MLDTSQRQRTTGAPVIDRLNRAWMVAGIAGFAILGATLRPSFDDLASAAVTVIPLLPLPFLVVALRRNGGSDGQRWLDIATVASIAVWSVVVFGEERWVAMTWVLYGLSFSVRGIAALLLATAVTAIWMISLLVGDPEPWRLLIPVAAFAAGAIIWATLTRSATETVELTELVEQLRATREELATTEREKGVLEERARFAGEIHDTLAQGFTSIVVLSRSVQRSGDWRDGIGRIEEVASDNLQAARRLVAAIGPAELDSSSLPAALEDHVTNAAPATTTEFDVVGSPEPLGAAADVALLRALQESILNVRTHSQASSVHVTLSYLDDRVVLDVVDDGVGFTPGDVADRGDVTGGQGLRAVRQRIESLGGTVEVETAADDGTAVSVQLPIGAP
ncbi:MAG: ATP-binding protein [Actinomycetota bacterium]